VPADSKELDKIVELPVNVAADRDGTLYGLHVGLIDQDLARLPKTG
jgi:hypothetical protein